MGKVRSRPAQDYLEESIFDSVLPELLLADAGPAAGVGGKAKAGGTITVMVPETKPCNTESEWRYQEPVRLHPNPAKGCAVALASSWFHWTMSANSADQSAVAALWQCMATMYLAALLGVLLGVAVRAGKPSDELAADVDVLAAEDCHLHHSRGHAGAVVSHDVASAGPATLTGRGGRRDCEELASKLGQQGKLGSMQLPPGQAPALTRCHNRLHDGHGQVALHLLAHWICRGWCWSCASVQALQALLELLSEGLRHSLALARLG
jgi:hypothetical protein